MQPAVFKAVPFDENWISHDKIDVHAIYRRPILDDLGEQVYVEGIPQWDYTTGLPVRRHYDWVKKGFQYVTLADPKSLANKHVLQGLRTKGLNPADYIMLRNRTIGQSPWNPQLYLSSIDQIERDSFESLRVLVERLGSEAVRDVKRSDDPTFDLPPHLRDIPPGGRVTVPTSAAPARPTLTTAATPAAPVTPKAPPKHSVAGRAAKQARKAAKQTPAPAAAAGAPS